MARLILYCLLAADLFITVVMARQFPQVAQTTAFQLHVPYIAKSPSSSIASSGGTETGFAGAPLDAHHMKHRPFDKSIAGGEAILCGLVMTAFAAIVCYIRVTRKRDSDDKF